MNISHENYKPEIFCPHPKNHSWTIRTLNISVRNISYISRVCITVVIVDITKTKKGTLKYSFFKTCFLVYK